MAYLDRIEESRREKVKENFENLKKHLSSLDKEQRINEFYPSLEIILDMEFRIKEQEKELKRYRDFFLMLRNLTPEGPSVNRIIG